MTSIRSRSLSDLRASAANRPRRSHSGAIGPAIPAKTVLAGGCFSLIDGPSTTGSWRRCARCRACPDRHPLVRSRNLQCRAPIAVMPLTHDDGGRLICLPTARKKASARGPPIPPAALARQLMRCQIRPPPPDPDACSNKLCRRETHCLIIIKFHLLRLNTFRPSLMFSRAGSSPAPLNMGGN